MSQLTSRELLVRARLGDTSALGRLVCRYLPRLQRWVHARLPRWVRTAGDTADVVHDAILRTLARLDLVPVRSPDALAAYLHEAVRNRIRDEHRRFARRGAPLALSETLADRRPSPLDRAMARQLRRRYRESLARLDAGDQELIVGHLELDYTHEQLGCMTGRTRNAARMALHRAIRRLADAMRD
jgi:RNA polymerase sigma-70 factor, ECF subfamily